MKVYAIIDLGKLHWNGECIGSMAFRSVGIMIKENGFVLLTWDQGKGYPKSQLEK